MIGSSMTFGRLGWRAPSIPALSLMIALAGCGGPPPDPPTVVEATVSATADANGAAPVAVRVYQLVSPAGFNGAQFFSLFDKDATTLKDDLVKKDDLLLVPGKSLTLKILPEDRAHAIGVFAAYKDYEHVTWRAVVDIPAHKTSVLTVIADKMGITATIKPAPPVK